MELAGGCQCGAVRYHVTGEPDHVALCHCRDCQRSAGVPTVSFAAFSQADFAIVEGRPIEFNSSGATLRGFCGGCGSSLFYRN